MDDLITIHPTHTLVRDERSWAARCTTCRMEASLFVGWISEPCAGGAS